MNRDGPPRHTFGEVEQEVLGPVNTTISVWGEESRQKVYYSRTPVCRECGKKESPRITTKEYRHPEGTFLPCEERKA